MSQNLSSSLPARTVVRAAWLSIAAAAGAVATPASAADTTESVIPLDVMAVSATRSPQDVRTLAQAVDILPLPDLHEMQIRELNTALARTPGTIISNTGAAGGQSSILMRGASSHQVSLMVDGVRLNDRSAAYVNFLGGADLSGLDRIEVLRGPQSTLYGSSAIGGLILLETARGDAEHTGGEITGTAGSFGTWGGSISGRGGVGLMGYSASVSRFETDNDRPDNAFEVLNASARLEGRPSDALLIGGTLRWQDSTYEEPGSRLFPFPGLIDFQNLLATAYGEWSESETLRSRVTIGRHHRDYDYSGSLTRNRRTIVDWQNTWQANTSIELVAGLNYEDSAFDVSGLRSSADQWAGYASATWRVNHEVVLNAGLRHDEFESFGGATTGRAGAAWLIDGGRTRLRATYGTGFTAPGVDDRYGIEIWGQLPNPDIEPEECRGWDVGFDRDFYEGVLGFSATWFQHRYRDLFEYEVTDFTTFEGRVVNRDRATAQGGELEVRWRPQSMILATLAYTYLDATDDETDTRLTRRPRHTVNLDGHWQPTRGLLVGAGLRVVVDRWDTTGVGLAEIEDYTTVRLYASYAVLPELVVKVRLENALDEEYEEVFGYPALPRAVYGSATWTF